jgi:hypothetical protein
MASFIVTKKQVYWSKTTDSHEEIIKEFGLAEQDVRNEYIFVRVEIAPVNGDYKTPIEKWVYKLDETNTDYLPEWYDAKVVEKRCRIALKDWHKACVLPANKTIENLTGNFKIVFGTIQCVSGGTIQCVCGGTIQRVDGGTIQYVDGGMIQCVCGGTIQCVCGGTIQCVYGGTIQRVDGGTVTFYITPPSDILKSANAVIIDHSGKTVVCYVGIQKTK